MTAPLETLLAEAMWSAQETQLVSYPDEFAPLARACLTALDAAGYVVVPKVATPEMERGGAQEYAMTAQRPFIAEANARAIWSAMIAAAPKIGGE